MKPNKMPVIKLPTILRFRKFFKKGNENDCWEWKGCISSSGYGTFHTNIGMMLAHRVSWTIYNGEIPEGLLVLHKCDNRVCINPNHLSIGDQSNNINDMYNKHRHSNRKLSDDDILFIRASKDNQLKLAAKFGVSQGNISMIKSGKTFKIY
jgi:hypothetical protein